jgi:hypothetical protein
MKSFFQVYKHSKTDVLNEQKENALKERSTLLTAIKKYFCINSFSECNESKKRYIKNNMINEMWHPVKGLTKAGRDFIVKNELPLNESSDEITVFKEVKRRLKSEEQNILKCVLSGDECPIIKKIKDDVEAAIGHKINVSLFKKTIATLIGEYVAKVIKSYKF